MCKKTSDLVEDGFPYLSLWVVTFKSFPSSSVFSFCCADLGRAIRIFLGPRGYLGIPIVSVCLVRTNCLGALWTFLNPQRTMTTTIKFLAWTILAPNTFMSSLKIHKPPTLTLRTYLEPRLVMFRVCSWLRMNTFNIWLALKLHICALAVFFPFKFNVCRIFLQMKGLSEAQIWMIRLRFRFSYGPV